jgi:hypothetical protein
MKKYVFIVNLVIVIFLNGCSKNESSISNNVDTNIKEKSVEGISKKSHIFNSNKDYEPSEDDIKESFKNSIFGINSKNLFIFQGLDIENYFCVNHRYCPDSIRNKDLEKNFETMINDLKKVDEYCQSVVVEQNLEKKCVVSVPFYMTDEEKKNIANQIMAYNNRSEEDINTAENVMSRTKIYLYYYLTKNMENGSWNIERISKGESLKN